MQQELERLVGTELGVTPWWRVEQSAVDTFAEVTGDVDPIHNDPRWAASGPYRGTIAHGFLTLSMLGKFSKEVGLPGSTTERYLALNYGLNKVRFIRPVPVGADLRARVRLLAVAPRPRDELLITSANDFECRGMEGTFVYAELLSVLVPREGAGA